MTKQAPALKHLQYLGTVAGPHRGSWGDPEFGFGTALRLLPDGSLRLYFGSYNPTRVLSAPVPLGYTGALTSIISHGVLPCEQNIIRGLFWHERDQAFYQVCHNDYDTNPAPAATLARGTFDSGNQLAFEARWSFANRSDKMVDGGVLELPDGRLAAGFGGYRSVVANGPASMGVALTAFTPPPFGSTSPIDNTPLVSYPFSATKVPRMTRSTDYVNTIAGDKNYIGTEPPGYTTWADYAQQNAVWIETPGLSGLLSIWQRATGTIAYTNAQVRAQGWRYDVVSYGAEVLAGGPPGAFQPSVDEPLVAPGLPVVGAGNTPPAPHPVTGVSYEPQTRTLVIGIGQRIGIDPASYATGYLFFRVLDPLKTFVVTETETITRRAEVFATSSSEATAAYLAGPPGTVVSDSHTVSATEKP